MAGIACFLLYMTAYIFVNVLYQNYLGEVVVIFGHQHFIWRDTMQRENAGTISLSDDYSIAAADRDQWGIYYSIYYSMELNGFFKEKGYKAYSGDRCYWILKGNEKIGGVIMAPNSVEDLFFIPPFNLQAEVLELLVKLLRTWSDPAQPVIAYGLLPHQLELYKNAGFTPEKFKSRWMQRPTDRFNVTWSSDLIVTSPVVVNGKLVHEAEISKLFYKWYAGGVEATNRNLNHLDHYVSWTSYFAGYTNDVLLNASSLVFDGNQYIGVCLIALENGGPVVYNISVHPDYRGRGLAKNMLKKALHELRNEYAVLRLYVMEGNDAEHLYYKMGFMPGVLEVYRAYL